MRRLAVTLLFTMLMVRCLVATAYAGEPVEKLLGDKQYWSAFAWGNPQESSLFAAVPWVSLGMRRHEMFRYAYQMKLDGVPVVLYALRNLPDNTEFGDFDITYKTLDKKEGAANFRRLLQWCTANYGDSMARIDNVKRIYTQQTFTASYTYWLKGTTLIRLVTSEVSQEGLSMYSARISYLDARQGKIRPPEKVLSCELDMRRLDKDIADIFSEKEVYKFDEADSVVKDLDDTVISEDVVSTDALLKFSKQSKTIMKEHIFNKSTGEYRFNLFNSRNKTMNVPDITINGKCTLAELPRKP